MKVIHNSLKVKRRVIPTLNGHLDLGYGNLNLCI